MKYRFRISDKKTVTSPQKNRRLRLMGRDTLIKLGSLPVPVEQIRLEDERKSSASFGRAALLKKLRTIGARFSYCISKITKKATNGVRKLLCSLGREIKGFARAIFDHITKEKPRTPLPTFLGAVTAAFLICTLTAACVLAGLFATYLRPYTPITVPALAGKTVDEAKQMGGQLNIIISYEDNPEIAGNTVISQSPPAGVTRRIYGKSDKCDVFITVSRPQHHLVPDGLVGSRLRDAKLSLLNSGLTLKIAERYSPNIPKGRVIEAYPQSGSRISLRESVTLVVSMGASPSYTENQT